MATSTKNEHVFEIMLSFNEICSVFYQFMFKFSFFQRKMMLCTVYLCLSWWPRLTSLQPPRVWSGQGSDKDLIAMGTEAGDVHVYSTSQSRLVLTRNVSGKVLSLCWGEENSLYIGTEASWARASLCLTPASTTPYTASLSTAESSPSLVTTLSAVISGAKHPRRSLHFDTSGSLLFSRYNRIH